MSAQFPFWGRYASDVPLSEITRSVGQPDKEAILFGGGHRMSKEAKDAKENDVDALFQLPLDEFTTARNILASRLKKTGRGDEAEKVKALVKPPISAWAVNQLYWKHREAFNDLIAAGQHLIQAQKSQLAGKTADFQGAQAEQRRALSKASLLAEAVLQEAGHKQTPDLMRRINAALEALSTYSSLPDTPRPGRLTADVNPPGFESLASLIPTARPAKAPIRLTRVSPTKPPLKDIARTKDEKDDRRIATAKAQLETAEERLREARRAADDLATARRKAAADVGEAEKKRLEAEERYEFARAAKEEARTRLESATAEVEKAARALDEASQAVEKARKRLKG